jgi:CRP-like cAMP-binding protein
MTQPTNTILRALPTSEYDQMAAKLRPVRLTLGQTIYQPEDKIDHVYFVTEGVVSLLATLENGATVEAGVIGPEGMVGLPIILGVKSTPNLALVQATGSALRMKAADIIVEFRKDGVLRDLLLRFTHTLFTQVAQTAACNRLHTVDQRLARWLLLTHDRVGGASFVLTQDFLSRMLGVRRAGVSVAASMLKQQQLIDYERGTITIIDRKGLELASCECYQIVKAEYDRYLKA